MSFLDLLRSFEDVRNKKNNCLFGKQIHETEDHLGIIRILNPKPQNADVQLCLRAKLYQPDGPSSVGPPIYARHGTAHFLYRPEKVLLLGLGGGALVHFLHHFSLRLRWKWWSFAPKSSR